jgi:hypothetical protein
MGSVRQNCFLAGSSNFLHSSFAKPGGFLFSKIFRPRADLSIVKTVREKNYFSADKLKDQFMKKNLFVSLALAGTLFIPTITRAQFADTVVSYTEGSGVLSGYNDPTAALGAPTTFIGYQNADPFNPPYQSSDIVGIGTGGSITLQFNTPIQNNPGNPFGLDFIIFGHAGFNVTNAYDANFNPIGTPATDGSLFTGGTADVRVSVSADGTTFYTLNPSLTPMVDGLFPTDASGNPFLPVNPSLTAADFSGLTLAQIESLYNGSAGGAGFDISWAIDGSDQSVSLPSIDYIRLDVLNDGTPAYIDAISVVPEPTTLALAISGAGLFLLRRRIK